MKQFGTALAVGFVIIGVVGPLANVDYDLYGDGVTGWGFTSGGESIPGPDMEADEGDLVTMHLFSDDALPHRWHLDYDSDGNVDSGEPISDLFTDSTDYTFSADVDGTFPYRCTIHPGTMYGSWTTNAAPETHDVAVTSVATDKTTVTQGDPVTISILVENQGTVSETTTVTAMAGSTTVGSNPVTIPAGNTEGVQFTWDTTGVPTGDYVIKGTASQVPGETDTADNELTDGTVTVEAPPPPPPPTGDLSARLVHRKAWPARHHFVISDGGPQTFLALIGNTGNAPVNAKVVFTVYDAGGNLVGSVESFVANVAVGGISRVDASWNTGEGRFSVVAQCWFDTNGDGTYDASDPGTKDFRYAAVP